MAPPCAGQTPCDNFLRISNLDAPIHCAKRKRGLRRVLRRGRKRRLTGAGRCPTVGTMDLGLDIDLRTRGRAARPITAEVVRELVPEDLVNLTEERGVKAPPISRIRDSHHALARAIASGLKPHEVAHATGYSLSRVSILSKDPAILDLIAAYREELGRETMETMIDLRNRHNLLHADAVQILHERMIEREGTEDEFSDKVLLEVVEMAADRNGFAPQKQATNVNISVTATAERIEKARQRAGLIEGVVLNKSEEPGA